MAKSKEKIKARKLRRKGESIKKIANLLSVSASTVSLWCRDVKLTNNQIENLRKRQTDPFYGKRLDYYLKKKKEFSLKLLNLKNEGISSIGKLTKREIFLIGIALYWGEGFKKDSLAGLATLDINIAKFFVFWLKNSFKIEVKDLLLRVTANISYKSEIRELEKYWSNNLKIPVAQFSKPFFQNTKWKKVYENKDNYHGVLRIRVRRSINLLRKIFGYIEGINLSITEI
jgi:transcriptional regulator with XRE-family HTH domain